MASTGEDKSAPLLLDVNKCSLPTAPSLWTGGMPPKTASMSPTARRRAAPRSARCVSIETATGKLLPDSIERTRAASLAWKHDNSGFFYTRYPKKGEVPEGQEVYHRHVFYHALGTDPAQTHIIFGEGRDPEAWPNVIFPTMDAGC